MLMFFFKNRFTALVDKLPASEGHRSSAFVMTRKDKLNLSLKKTQMLLKKRQSESARKLLNVQKDYEKIKEEQKIEAEIKKEIEKVEEESDSSGEMVQEVSNMTSEDAKKLM